MRSWWFGCGQTDDAVAEALGLIRDDGSWQAREAIAERTKEKYVWRITQLLKAALNECAGRPGDAPGNRLELGTLALGIYDDLLKSTQLRLPAIDTVLKQAESSKQQRDNWIRKELTPARRAVMLRLAGLDAA